MNKFIKISAKEEYKTPLCEVLDVETAICAASTGETFVPVDPWEGADGWE